MIEKKTKRPGREREVRCELCGKAFLATRSDARLCGPRCRQWASRDYLRRHGNRMRQR